MTVHVAFLLYPQLTQLDLTGPFEVLHRLPGAQVDLVWKSKDPVRAEGGLQLLPTATFAERPTADVVCVPGGPGQPALMEDDEVLEWLRRAGAGAGYVTSVCVGSLVLGAAGLLAGYRATCHWASLPLLASYGATPVDERVVVDRTRITGGGVTAGLDFGLRLAETLTSTEVAECLTLALEYDPAPPFPGHPRSARPEVVALVRELFAARLERRTAQAEAARRALTPTDKPRVR